MDFNFYQGETFLIEPADDFVLTNLAVVAERLRVRPVPVILKFIVIWQLSSLIDQ